MIVLDLQDDYLEIAQDKCNRIDGPRPMCRCHYPRSPFLSRFAFLFRLGPFNAQVGLGLTEIKIVKLTLCQEG